MKISIITLFPEMFAGVFDSSIIRRAQEEEKVQIRLVNLRDFGEGKHKIVDDTPYGGGVGMVLKVDVAESAISAVRTNEGNEMVILLDPKGKKYNQKTAEEYSILSHLILICGHYEGVDARINNFIDGTISIGDYVMSGGEIPAMVVTESVTRLVPGVLRKDEAKFYESFSSHHKRALEHPHYTRPRTYKGFDVPEILLSGDREKIEEFRKNESRHVTLKNRPDLIND